MVRGIVQGVGFRPFVYAKAHEMGIAGTVKNLGSEVEIHAAGERFEDFVSAIAQGPPLARIDSLQVFDVAEPVQEGFLILPSATGAMTGMIPPDVAICDACITDIFQKEGRYENYWATSCVNCGPRYSIIEELPYDRERTSMSVFPMCPACAAEYHDPHCRRHHAQTIACKECGPGLALFDAQGRRMDCSDPVTETAALLDAGRIVGVRGVGGFHIACIEESANELKRRLGRVEQPFAVMVRPDAIDRIARVSGAERALLLQPGAPHCGAHETRPARTRRNQQPPYHRLHASVHRASPSALLPAQSPAPGHDERQHARLPDDNRD